MTWIEVVDSAVKIGLGAVIAGIVAIISITLNHRNLLIQKRAEILAKALEEVSAQFEGLDSEFITRVLTFKVHEQKEHLSTTDMEKYTQQLELFTQQAHLKFELLRAKLHLYGCNEAAEIIVKFEDSYSDILHFFEFALEKREYFLSQYDSAFTYSRGLKIDFYNELNNKLNHPR